MTSSSFAIFMIAVQVTPEECAWWNHTNLSKTVVVTNPTRTIFYAISCIRILPYLSSHKSSTVTEILSISTLSHLLCPLVWPHYVRKLMEAITLLANTWERTCRFWRIWAWWWTLHIFSLILYPLLTPYGGKDTGQQWLRWLVARWHQAIPE